MFPRDLHVPPWSTCFPMIYMFLHDLHVSPRPTCFPTIYMFPHDLHVSPWSTCFSSPSTLFRKFTEPTGEITDGQVPQLPQLNIFHSTPSCCPEVSSSSNVVIVIFSQISCVFFVLFIIIIKLIINTIGEKTCAAMLWEWRCVCHGLLLSLSTVSSRVFNL